MAFKARLDFKDRIYDLRNRIFFLNCDADANGSPFSAVYRAKISITKQHFAFTHQLLLRINPIKVLISNHVPDTSRHVKNLLKLY